MNEVKIYTAADFANYHAGTMPVQDMHALEKVALDDPFLADALEGYAFTNSAEQDITSIKQRLEEKNITKKVFFLSPSANNGWWRIAAAVLAIAGGSIVFFHNLNNKLPQNALAQNEIKVPVQMEPTAVNDSNKTENIPSAVQDKTIAPEKSSGKLFADNVSPKIQPIHTETKSAPASAPVAQAITADEPLDKNKEQRRLNEEREQVEDIALNKSKKEDSQNVATQKSLQGRVAGVQVMSANKDKKVSRTLGYSSVVSGSITPEISIAAYEEYIRKNKVVVKDSSGNTMTGDVLLFFTLSKKGHPKNIMVSSSSCSLCEPQAIKLLKDGPKFNGKKGSKGILLIKF